MKITLTVNGRKENLEVEPSTTLLEALRMLGLYSVRKGCDTASCGVCTVLMDSKPILSCCSLAVQAQGHSITTVEGLEKDKDFEEIRKNLLSEGAAQCGYCGPSLLFTVYSLKKRNIKSLQEIQKYLVGNLCRCTGYHSQLRAIKEFMEVGE